MTESLRIDPTSPAPDAISHAAETLRHGGLVAFPTETVYGLGANALDRAAVARIFAAKERPPTDPLIVHLASSDELPTVAESIPPLARQLADAAWPGPLTLVLRKSAAVPPEVTAGLATVAVRVPRHPVALALLRASGVPIAAPSANRFGHTSPTTARHVLDDLEGRIDLVLDAGPTPLGVESSVLDMTRTPPVLLRPGGMPREAIEALVGPVVWRADAVAADGAAPSPGLQARHYAPRAELVLVTGERQPALQCMVELARAERVRGRRVGLLAVDDDREELQSALGSEGTLVFRSLGREVDQEGIARRLFAALRELDDAEVEVVLARELPSAGLGLAINDRLRRAAARVI